MTDAELDDLLRQWGTLSKYQAERRESSGDVHVLQRSREFAPMTRARAAARIVGRDGVGRRTLMAAAAGVAGMRVVAAGFVDPIPCKETRPSGGLRDFAYNSIPEHLRPLDKAVMVLQRADNLRGLCLRFEYCDYGTQLMKAGKVSNALGSRVGLRVYRESLAHAKGWMLGRLG